jgi:hypothetical protein
MSGIRIDQVDVADRPGQRHIQGVDIEFVGFERLVGLVLGSAVLQLVAGEVGRGDAFGILIELVAVVGDEAEQRNAVVFDSLVATKALGRFPRFPSSSFR